MKTSVLEIEGMACNGCAGSVEKALAGLRGVESVDVNLEAAKATVTYAASSASTGDLEQAVRDAGYKVTKIQ